MTIRSKVKIMPNMRLLTFDGEECERCGHQWLRKRKHVKPKVCPNCKSPHWGTPRRDRSAAALSVGLAVEEPE